MSEMSPRESRRRILELEAALLGVPCDREKRMILSEIAEHPMPIQQLCAIAAWDEAAYLAQTEDSDLTPERRKSRAAAEPVGNAYKRVVALMWLIREGLVSLSLDRKTGMVLAQLDPIDQENRLREEEGELGQ